MQEFTMDISACVALLDALTRMSVSAAEAILRTREHHVRIKADGSPVTEADEAAEEVIREGLLGLALSFPIVSEERAGRERPTIAREGYFLVDPLDGTREFIAGRDEYTVNIGLVAGGAPILGVIAAPARGLIWRGVVGHGAERLEFSSGKISAPQAIRTRPRRHDQLVVMTSRSHLDPRTRAFLDGFANVQPIASGSSVKFCYLAEGSADLYPRLAPTRYWDVAAGHAILTAAGGNVLQPDGTPIDYGNEDVTIPAFVAWGDPASVRS